MEKVRTHDGQINITNLISIKKISFPWSRLFAVSILLFLSYLQYIQWGAEFRIENGDGNWMALGGPSLFYPTGVITLLFAIPLLIYILFMPKMIKIKMDGEKIFLKERRWYWFPKSIEINKENIKKSSLKYGMNNMWFFWLIPLGLQSFFLFEDGFAFLLNSFKFGLGIVTGLYYVLHAFGLLIVISIILSSRQFKLTILSDTNQINLIFWRGLKSKNSYNKINNNLKILPNYINTEFRTLKNKKTSIDYNQMLTGIIFLALTIIFSLTRFYAGVSMRIILYCAGIVYLFKGINHYRKFDIWDLLIVFVVALIAIIQFIFMIKYVDFQLTSSLSILLSEIFISFAIIINIGLITYQKLRKR